jgi:hypothetical protein
VLVDNMHTCSLPLPAQAASLVLRGMSRLCIATPACVSGFRLSCLVLRVWGVLLAAAPPLFQAGPWAWAGL